MKFFACIASVAVALTAACGAAAHSFYDKACCADADCYPVACERITAVNGGFEYRDVARATYFFSRDKMHLSEDGRCHVCLHRINIDGPNAPTCLYLPTGL